MKAIRIVIVDDHAVFREGLRALLARIDGFEVVGEAATTDEAVDTVASQAPDVVLMDLTLPGDGGAVATSRIVARDPRVVILALTMHADEAHLRGALHAGARGYLLKDAEPDAIVRAISAVGDGQMVLDHAVAAGVLAAAANPGPDRPFPSLTDREFEILDRIARGLRNDAIAKRMGISLKTVQNNVSAVLLKLGASDRAQAVAMARDAGLGQHHL